MRPTALHTVILAHQAEILRYVRYLGASPDVAEDVAQETFLAVLGTDALPAEAGSRRLAAWLRGVARNLFLMHCRRVRTRRETSLDLELAERVWREDVLHGGDGFDAVEALRRCLESLPVRQREAVERRYVRREGRQAMAAALGLSADGVKSMLRRIRAALGRCVQRRLRGETS